MAQGNNVSPLHATVKNPHVGLLSNHTLGKTMIMKKLIRRIATAGLILGSMAIVDRAAADVTIANFSNFKSDELYPSWKSATVVSTETNYAVIAIGYGANYKYIGYPAIDGTGCTNIELDVTLSGPPAADGQLGPIVTLIDKDGTIYSYCWYGQTLGHHVLTMPIKSPTIIDKAGTVPGLDLANLQHLHLKLDPGQYGTSGSYTISWNKLRLVGGSSKAEKP